MSLDYARYLAAKVSVDDRALNRTGLAQLQELMPTAPRVLEVGAGLGTMLARLIDWGVLTDGEYTLLDVDEQLLRDARTWLTAWAAERSLPCRECEDGLVLGELRVRFTAAELGSYLTQDRDQTHEPDTTHKPDRTHKLDRGADVLIANAVLDLVDLPTVLPRLLRLLAPGGSYWFTINYDGETIFAPEHPQDAAIMAAYHRDMDTRVRYGRPAGGSRTGRQLFGQLRAAGAPASFAGSSDWVVHPDAYGRYPYDEAYFVGCILDTIQDALAGRVPERVLADWLGQRRSQLAAGELVYLAHQLDFVGRFGVEQ